MMKIKHDDWDKDDDQEDSTGIRRVNNWPLVIVMMVAICFVITMISVMVHRSERQLSQASDQEHPSDSTIQAGRIIGKHHGFIQARMPMTEKTEVLPPPLAKTNSIEMPIKDEQQSAREAELQELRIAKLEQIKSARQSKPSVPVTFDEGYRHSQNLPDVLRALKSTLTHNNVIQNDPMALYQQTLRALQTSGVLPKNTPLGEDSAASDYANDHYQAFDQSDDTQRWRLTSQLEAPDSRYQLRAGYVIPGLLISGINSDIPGQIVAQVAQSVYDTATGRYLLIPQGTRLVGSYASDINFGQERVLVAWQRLIFPDGKVLDLSAMPGADSTGYSGFVDQTNAHYLQLFGSAFLMSAVVAATSLSQLNANSSNGGYGQPTTAGVLNQSLGQQLGQVTAQLIAKNLNRAPTLEIRPGFRFNVIVTKDLTFHQPYRAFDYR